MTDTDDTERDYTHSKDRPWPEDDDPKRENGGDDKLIGFAFTTFDDAGKASIEKRWLIKHLLALGETSAWVGPPGSLKSAILIDIARAVATGADWCGKRNKGPRAVVYFALERSDLVRRRLRAFAKRHNIAGVPIAVVSKTIDFMDPKVAAEVVATIDAVRKVFGIEVGLIIIDTLAKAIAAGGGDEDKARDHGKVYANVARIKEQRDVHVALACHPGKDESKGVRGSSAALGDFDVEVTITTDDGIRTATITKNNDGAEGPIAAFEARCHTFGVDQDGDQIEVWLAEPATDAPAATPSKAAKRDWSSSKSLRLLKRSIDNALVEAGRDLKPFTDSAMVRAVDKQAVRVEFMRQHSADEEDTRKRAFNRAVEDAQDATLIGVLDIEGVQFVWLAR